MARSRPEFHEWRPHPWHGLEPGRELPLYVNAYIEITPFDVIKYEVDKASGCLKVERLQHYFNTYKLVPGAAPQISVQRMYGAGHAAHVVGAAIADYKALLEGR